MTQNKKQRKELEWLKDELLEALFGLIKRHVAPSEQKWLRTREVCEVLGISAGSLQKLRNKGVLPYTKVEGVLFYQYSDIQRMLLSHRKHRGATSSERGAQ